MHKVRVTIVVVHVAAHVGAVKIYVTAVEALREKERRGQNRMKLSLAQKSGAFLSMTPNNVLFLQVFFRISPGFGPNSGGSGALFS